MNTNYTEIAELIINARYPIAFTGAGISVESGIPPFRGQGGLWTKYDPDTLDLSRFRNNPGLTWGPIKEIFYDHWGEASPNAAHYALARMEEMSLLKGIVTMNIDALHQKAGSRNVVEFHGTLDSMVCMRCHSTHSSRDINLSTLPPRCKCGGVLKPNFIFFGENIPANAYTQSMEMAEKADLVIVAGTTGEVMPACCIPTTAARKGARIVEINPTESSFTHSITTHYLPEKAGKALGGIMAEVEKLYQLQK